MTTNSKLPRSSRSSRSSTQPLRIGVLGCARIARQFVRDVKASKIVRVDAVASREASKAQAFAKDFGLPRAYGSYEALLADDAIDAIYIPLPNSMHAEWAIKSAAAGKHVLCEKPLALSLAEARAMFNAANEHGVMLLEAYPYWFQPQTGDLVKLLSNNVIGQVQSMHASFGFNLVNGQGNIRLNPELGGGALLDLGSYNVSLMRLVTGCAPKSVQAHATWTEGGAKNGVDIAMSAALIYADGRVMQMSCAMNAALHRNAQIIGTLGTIETEFLNHTAPAHASKPHPWKYTPSQMRLLPGRGRNKAFEEIQSPAGSGFRFAAEAFADCVKRRDFDAIDRAAAASLDIAATLEALAKSARSGKMEAV